jgi:hypothetical protein
MKLLAVRTLTILAAITAAGALNTAAAVSAGGTNLHAAPQSLIVRVNDDDGYRYRRHYRRGRVVDAPFTHVDSRGPVIVDAPFTHVGVWDNHVRVIAPFVNLSIPR